MGSKPDTVKLLTNTFQWPAFTRVNWSKFLAITRACSASSTTMVKAAASHSSRLTLNIVKNFFILLLFCGS